MKHLIELILCVLICVVILCVGHLDNCYGEPSETALQQRYFIDANLIVLGYSNCNIYPMETVTHSEGLETELYIIFDQQSGKLGYYDTLFDYLQVPIYNDIVSFNVRDTNNLLGVQDASTGLYGFVDSSNGEVVISFRFNEVTPFEKGISIVTIAYENENGFVDGLLHNDGALYILTDMIVVDSYNADSFIVAGENGYGVIDQFGNIIVPLIYEDYIVNSKGEFDLR